jgi:hypothetical protein
VATLDAPRGSAHQFRFTVTDLGEDLPMLQKASAKNPSAIVVTRHFVRRSELKVRFGNRDQRTVRIGDNISIAGPDTETVLVILDSRRHANTFDPPLTASHA